MSPTAEEKRQAEVAAHKNNVLRDRRAALRNSESDAADIGILLQQTPSEDVVNQIAASLDSLKTNLGLMSAADMKLIKLLSTDLDSATLSNKEAEICEDYMAMKTQYNKLFGSYYTMKKKVEQPVPTSSEESPANRSSILNSILEGSLLSPLVNIPDVPKFDGSFSSFPEFYDDFVSTVHENEALDDTKRLKYLKKAMVGKMANYLKDVGSDGKLYRPTLKALHDTYYNRRRIIADHFSTIVDLPVMKTNDTRESIDKVNRALRGLEVCNINTKGMSPFVAFLVARKIPDRLRQDWDTSNADYSSYQSFESLSTFLNARCLSYEASTAYKIGKPKEEPPPKKFAGAGGTAVSCPICKEEHSLELCKVFLGKNSKERFLFLKSHSMCIKCLRKGHTVSKCKSTVTCNTCKGSHNTLVHREREPKETKQSDPLDDNNKAKEASTTDDNKVTTMCAFSNKTVFLSTAIVNVTGKRGTERGRVLLDPGSETTLITREFCNRAKLNVERNTNSTVLVGVHGNSKELNQITRCILRSRFSDFSIAVEAEVIDKIPYSVKRRPLQIDIGALSLPFAESYDLPYDYVDLLLGNEYYEFCMEERRHFFEDICLKESRFGMVLAGSARSSFFAEKSAFCGLTNLELDNRLRSLFDIDIPANNKVDINAEFDLIEKHFKETHSIDPVSGRFMIRLPVRQNIVSLKSSYEQAKSMLIRSERRRTPEEHEVYCRIFDEYLEMGHMRKLSSDHVLDVAYFIPHHLVKLNRIVYNASFSYDGIESLNSQLLPGPVLQPKLFSHIICFRIDLIAVSADIFRMYRSILVHPSDWKYQTILFRKKLNDFIEMFSLTTLTNGIGPASYIATRCLEAIAEFLENDQSPIDLTEFIKLIDRILEILIECIRKHFYMDNFMRVFNSVSEASVVVEALRKLLDHFGFHLCKFQSNSSEFLSSLDPSLVDEVKNKVFGDNSETYVKLLGLNWLTESDEFRIVIRTEELPSKITKRVMLSDASKLYDIIGMLSPVSIRARLLLQELWKEGRGWDEPISDELKSSFFEYRNDLKLLDVFSLPRAYCYSASIKSRQIIGFCDASTRAYCAVLYLRSIDSQDNVVVSFICAKTRVAPIKSVQIHRLELLAKQLLSDLLIEVNRELKITDTYLFSDSMVALSWLNIDPSKLLLFVSNRVRRILASTLLSDWRHVDGIDNPADCATRGISASSLLNSSLWRSGPAWLSSNEFDTKVACNFKPASLDTLPECKKTKTSFLSYVPESFVSVINRSSFQKTVNITAYVLRFIRNVRLRLRPAVTEPIVDFNKIPPLTPDEHTQAFNRLVLIEQKLAYANEYDQLKSNKSLTGKILVTLNPFIDESGLLRVRGRLSNSAFSFDTKHPIIIPARSQFMKLYAQHVHSSYFHAERSLMSTIIRAKFWVVGGLLSVIKNVIVHCVFCAKLHAKSVEQIMADLPKERTEICRPFTTTGVDLSGHQLAKCVNHRTYKNTKVYIAFFVCFVSRAVHIELVEDLSSEAFCNAFERFINRRGLPRTMYSDNGTNFVGFSNLLTKKHSLEWKFIPPRSPHQGGLWEAAVKAGKSCIVKAVGKQVLSFAEWNTLLTKVECILNSRPMSYSKFGNDIEPLTPAHLLIGSSFKENPTVDTCKAVFKVRYRLWRSIVDSFWSSWRSAYLNQLQIRNKWQVKETNLKVGDVVLLRMSNVGVLDWPMGCVEKTFPDDFGAVRTVEVRLSSGAIRRTAVKRLVLLPIS